MPAPTHTPVDLTDEQRANLVKLAAYLRTLPADYRDFEMAAFEMSGDGFAKVVSCGTAACAAGHGPKACIPPEDGEGWYDYSSRSFVPHGDAWDWCFSGCWDDVDNTVHGAAARIEWLLEHGLPVNHFDQEMGDAPLCYTPEYQSALAALNAETNEMVALSNGRLA